MTVTTPPRPGRWTIEDLERLPDDGNRYELVDGNLLVTPGPVFSHLMVQRRLSLLLQAATPDHLIADHGGWGIQSGDSYFEPDVLVFRADTEGRTARYIDVADVLLAVEVLSPSNPGNDRVTKLNKYAEGGIPDYWIVDERERRLSAYELRSGRSVYTLHADVTAGSTFRTDRPFPIALDPAQFCR